MFTDLYWGNKSRWLLQPTLEAIGRREKCTQLSRFKIWMETWTWMER